MAFYMVTHRDISIPPRKYYLYEDEFFKDQDLEYYS